MLYQIFTKYDENGIAMLVPQGKRIPKAMAHIPILPWLDYTEILDLITHIIKWLEEQKIDLLRTGSSVSHLEI